MHAAGFDAGYADRWDTLVHASGTGTFLHTRRFLGYHGTRFEDRSVMLLDDNDRLVGVLPAAVDPADPTHVVSHPGATYGGLVFDDARSPGEVAGDMLATVCRFLGDRGHTRLTYKSVPLHLQARPCQQDLHAIWRTGGRLVRRDLWNVIDLRAERALSRRRAEAIRAATRNGVAVTRADSDEAYSAFAAMLGQRLEERHRVAPVHNAEEMRQIRDLLAPSVQLWLATDPRGSHVAGVWTFEFAHVALHGQYGASTEAGRRLRAGDLLLHEVIDSARTSGKRWFSWGRSTEGDGKAVNDGLFRYKSAFGPGSIVHDFYEIDLS